MKNRKTTKQTYLRIWRQFNNFLIKLDNMPKDWEDRVTLFIGFKIEQGLQSSTVKTYVSAIKRLLLDDGYQWNDTKILLGSLTQACRLVNNQVHTRLPIQCKLLELILFEVQRVYLNANQPYLMKLYVTLFSLAYYGLFRICELTKTDSNHAVKAKDVHVAENKNKIMLILRSSKTHTKGMRPQKIKIVANSDEASGNYKNKYFCPFSLTREYMQLRGSYNSDDEQFFIFRDRSHVTAENARQVLKSMISRLGLDEQLYGFHSLRIGRTSDLIKFSYSLEQVKRMGRWKSNIVYKYIRN